MNLKGPCKKARRVIGFLKRNAIIITAPLFSAIVVASAILGLRGTPLTPLVELAPHGTPNILLDVLYDIISYMASGIALLLLAIAFFLTLSAFAGTCPDDNR